MHTHHHHHEITSADETLALIKYMLNHNKSHTTELESLASKVDNSGASENLAKAIECYANGNDFLAKALADLESGE